MENDNNFVLPDAFKEKDWAKDVHSLEEACAKIDNQHVVYQLPGKCPRIWEDIGR